MTALDARMDYWIELYEQAVEQSNMSFVRTKAEEKLQEALRKIQDYDKRVQILVAFLLIVKDDNHRHFFYKHLRLEDPGRVQYSR